MHPMAAPTQRYDLLRPIANGGMGEVFLAELSGEAGFRKRVALKRIKPSLARDPAFVERFISEAKLAVTLSHANIVQTLDLGRLDDTLFLAMEYVNGVDLARLVAAARAVGQPVPLGVVHHVAVEALRALAYAHQRIIHCDVSPSNLLVSYEGEVKLTDFGVAMWSSLGERQHATIAGKVRYMAPEMLRGDPFDARVDLYALAVVLGELLELEPAFTGSTEDIRRDVLAGACRLRGRSDLSPELATLLRRARAVSPSERPSAATHFLAELTALAPRLGLSMTAPQVGEWARRLVPPELPRLDGLAQLVGRTDNGTQSAPVAVATTSLLVRPAEPAVVEPARSPAETPPPKTRRWWPWLAVPAAAATCVAVWLTMTAPEVAPRVVTRPPPLSAPAVEETPAVVAPANVVETPNERPVEPAKPPTGVVKRPKVQLGHLNVSSEPWAHVHIDGVDRGTTPLYQIALAAGRHRVVFTREGHAQVERIVNIGAGETQLLDLDLK